MKTRATISNSAGVEAGVTRAFAKVGLTWRNSLPERRFRAVPAPEAVLEEG